MSTLKQQTAQALDELLSFLLSTTWKNEYYLQVKELRGRLDEPCVLAVAGRVKAGKSSFINAFLGADLALTGTTETTATINYFRFGHPEDPSKPVRVVWTNDRESWENVDFLNSLQGNTMEILKKANGIKRLEFFVDNPKLEHIRLVDTPGTGAIVGDDGEGHETVTRDFFNLRQELRERHSQETLKISGEADAVIYLNGAAVGQVSDANFLQDFQGDNHALHAFNTIGVMSKIDLSDEILEQREKFAQDMAEQYNKVLSMPIQVLPVSSGIQHFLDHHTDEEILAMQEKLRTGFEGSRLALALKSDKLFKAQSLPGCSLPIAERIALCHGIPWRVFVVIARILVSEELMEAKKKLADLSGFAAVEKVLESHFFKRGILLRCHTILRSAYDFLQKLERVDLYEYRQQRLKERTLSAEYTDYITSHPQFQDTGTGGQLLHFVARHLPENQYESFLAKIQSLKEIFENLLFNELSRANRNFDGLRLLEENSECVSEDERKELQTLFGLFSETKELTREYCVKRQIFWRQLRFASRSSQRKEIAALAEVQYGLKVASFLKEEG